MSETPPNPETKASPASGLLLIAGNMASFSAIGVITAVVCSTIFLSSYLSVLDGRLIWIIDYADIFKIGLIALAVLFGIAIIVVAIIANILMIKKDRVLWMVWHSCRCRRYSFGV